MHSVAFELSCGAEVELHATHHGVPYESRILYDDGSEAIGAPDLAYALLSEEWGEDIEAVELSLEREIQDEIGLAEALQDL